MSIVIRVATTEAELEAVCRFRYEINVHELRRSGPYINHATGELRHPLDETGVNIAAFDGSTIIGAVRQNYGPAARFCSLASFYAIAADAGTAESHVMITTGLMVAARARGGIVGTRLACVAYVHALKHSICRGYIDCIPALEPLFKRLGYVDHLPEAVHPEYDFPVRRLKINLFDRAHLQQMRSPFLEYLQDHQSPRSSTVLSPSSLVLS